MHGKRIHDKMKEKGTVIKMKPTTKKPVIYFRADGNEKIATGHIMRCLSIARACISLNADVCFLVSDDTSMSVLQERFLTPDEFPARCLHSDYKKPEEELPAIQAVLKDAHCLFVDSYFVTEAYLSALKKFCPVAYLDDLLAFDYPVDLIINYDITDKPICYRKAARTLLGAAYAPLRAQFQHLSYQVRPQVHDILLSTGGTDSYNVAGQLLEKVLSSDTLKDFHYHIVTSRLNSHYGELEQLAHRFSTIHIHENVQNMAALMCTCDLALSAGGTTLYELCAAGVPAISFLVADNQLTAVKTFAAEAMIPYAGDVRTALQDVINSVTTFLQDNIASYEKREKSSQQMRAFVDGNGSARIAAALLS